jgi:hypothetical protein
LVQYDFACYLINLRDSRLRAARKPLRPCDAPRDGTLESTAQGGGGEQFNHSEEVSPTRYRVAPTQSSPLQWERSRGPPPRRRTAPRGTYVLLRRAAPSYLPTGVYKRGRRSMLETHTRSPHERQARLQAVRRSTLRLERRALRLRTWQKTFQS